MVDNKDNTKGNDKGENSGPDMFSDDYMSSVQEQMKKFSQNPDMLQKALKPFMDMQRDYMDNPEKLAKLTQDEKNQAEEMLDIVKKIRARLIRLEKRLKEAGVIKPLES